MESMLVKARVGLDAFMGASEMEQDLREFGGQFNDNAAVNKGLTTPTEDASNNSVFDDFDWAKFDEVVLEGVDLPTPPYVHEGRQEDAVNVVPAIAPAQLEILGDFNIATTTLHNQQFDFIEQPFWPAALDPRLLNQGLGQAFDKAISEDEVRDFASAEQFENRSESRRENEHEGDAVDVGVEEVQEQIWNPDEAEDERVPPQTRTHARGTRKRARESYDEEHEREPSEKRFKAASALSHQKATGFKFVRKDGDRFEAAPRRQARTTAQLSQEEYVAAYRDQGMAESKAKNCFRKRAAEQEKMSEQEEWKRQLEEAQAHLNPQGYCQDQLAEHRPSWWVTWEDKPFLPSRQYGNSADEQKKLKNTKAQFRSQQEKRALRFDLWQSARFYTRMAGFPGVKFFSQATLRPVVEDWNRLNGSVDHKPELSDNIGEIDLETLAY